MKPLILLSNDDGVHAKGLHELIRMLRSVGNLFVVAPDRVRSGASSFLTAEIPITARLVKSEEGLTVYSCSGSPTDCVKLALDQLLQRMPDLVVGGINHGNNASVNAHYSGTVGVVREGALHGIPSVAFSLCNHSLDADFAPAEPYVVEIVEQVLEQSMPYGSFLNVNFPDTSKFSGVRVCRMAYSRWQDEYVPCEHPHGARFYWLGGEFINDEPDEEDTDSWALERDYVAITPLKVDVTDYDLKVSMENWKLGEFS